MIRVAITDAEILRQAAKLGYTIKIEVKDDHKQPWFCGFAHGPKKAPASYALGYTNDEIKLREAKNLLIHSGLCLKTVVAHK